MNQRNSGIGSFLSLVAALTCIATSAQAGGVDLTINRIEVTQGIQSETGNTVQLVEGRETTVRVYIDSSPNTWVGEVDASLEVDGASVRTIGSLNGPIDMNTGTTAAEWDHTINFCFIPNAPIVDLTVTLDPDNRVAETDEGNNTSVLSMGFTCETNWTVGYLAVDYAGLGLPDSSLIEPGRGDAFINASFPVSNLNYYKLGEISLSSSVDLEDNVTRSGFLISLWVYRLLYGDIPQLYAWIPGCLSYNGRSVDLLDVSFGNTEFDTSGTCSGPCNRYQRTIAHELEHNLGMSHSTGTLDWHGVDIYGIFDSEFGVKRIRPYSLAELMWGGKCTGTAWVDTWEWTNMLAHEQINCSGLPDERGRLGQAILVSGYLNDSTGNMEMDIVFEGVPLPDVGTSPTGRYLLREMAGSIVTFEARFDIDECESDIEGDDTGCARAFGLTVPGLGGYDRIEIWDSVTGMLMATRVKSAHPPVPMFTTISDGDTLTSGSIIAYTATDADPSTSFEFEVSWSNDNGATWNTMTLYNDELSTTFPGDDLPGCLPGQGRLRVRCTDGFNLGVAEVGNLTFSDFKSPSVSIVGPVDGAQMVEGAGLHFRAQSYDREDGVLSDSIEWSSDVDGVLGTGRVIEVNGLSLGHHTICADSTDSSGMGGFACIDIEIVPRVFQDGNTFGVNPHFNEIYTSHYQIDDHEFFEIVVNGLTDIGDIALMVIDGDGADAGIVDRVDIIPVGTTAPTDGYYVIGDIGVSEVDQVFGGPLSSHTIENGTNTFLLVRTSNPAATLGLVGTDLDLTNSGTLSLPPFITETLDSAATRDDIADVTYGVVVMGPDDRSAELVLPPGIFRPGDYPAAWDEAVYLNFDDEALIGNVPTPGSMNGLAGPEAGYRYGILHRAIPPARLDLGGGGLTVLGDGGGTPAGVRYLPGAAEYMIPNITIPPASGIADGASYICRAYETTGAQANDYAASIGLVADAGRWSLIADVTPVQGGSASFELLNDGIVIVEGPWPPTGPITFEWDPFACTIRPNPCASSGPDHLTGLAFDNQVNTVFDGSSYNIDEVRIIVQSPILPTALRRVDVIAAGITDPSQFAESNVTLGRFSTDLTALNSSHMRANAMGVLLTSLDTAGSEGITVTAPGSAEIGAEWLPLDPAGLLAGDRIMASALGEFSGSTDALLGSVTLASNAAEFEVTADFSPIGSTQQLIQIVNNGVLVAEYPNQSGLLATIAGPIDIIEKTTPGEITTLSCFIVRTPVEVVMTVPGFGSEMGDELRVLAEAPSSEPGPLMSYSVGFNRPGALQFFPDVQLVNAFSTPEPVCLADFNGDGVLDFFDVAAYLAAFSAGDPVADLTGDGVFDFFDVALFLNAFSAGCP